MQVHILIRDVTCFSRYRPSLDPTTVQETYPATPACASTIVELKVGT
jgi:hypothetical protein